MAGSLIKQLSIVHLVLTMIIIQIGCSISLAFDMRNLGTIWNM